MPFHVPQITDHKAKSVLVWARVSGDGSATVSFDQGHGLYTKDLPDGVGAYELRCILRALEDLEEENDGDA